MRCTRLVLVATCLSALVGRTALAQEEASDSASAACAAVDSAVVDSAVRVAVAAARGPRPVEPKIIIVTQQQIGPTYGSLDAVRWQAVDLPGGAQLSVGSVYTDPVTRTQQLLLRLPPNAAIPAHWHGSHETLLVMRGAVLVRDSTGRVVRLGVGNFTAQPAGAPHTLATPPDAGALLLVTSDGLWDIHLADEPRGAPTQERAPGTTPLRDVGGEGRR